MNELTVRSAALKAALLGRKDNRYRDDAESLVAFIEAHGGELTEDVLREYHAFVVQERGGKAWSAATAARRLSGAKANVRRLLDVSTDLPQAAVLGVERVLREMKAPKVNSKAVSADKILTKEESDALLAGLPDTRMAALVEFLLHTGCRISEAIGILAEDCRRKGDHFEVRVQGKGKKERIVFISREIVDRIRAAYGRDTYLFNAEGKPLERTAITNRLKYHSKQILGRALSAHALRHTFITRLIESGLSLPAVSRYAGHASIQTTADIYSADVLSWEDLKTGV